jgi:hypothetical protein
MLPKRVVHFTKNQVLWECREMCASEDGLRVVTPFGITKDIQQDLTSFLDHWHVGIIAGEYSKRQFTFPTDRVIAIAGLARLFSEIYNLIYIAGMWAPRNMMTFARNEQLMFRNALFWKTNSPGAEISSQQRRSLIWSLLSHDGPVTWPQPPGLTDDNWSLRVKGCELSNKGETADPFGLIDLGCLHIEGLPVRCSLTFRVDSTSGHLIPPFYHLVGTQDLYLDYKLVTTSSSIQMMCLFLERSKTIANPSFTDLEYYRFLVLDSIPGQQRSFRRMGIVKFGRFPARDNV